MRRLDRRAAFIVLLCSAVTGWRPESLCAGAGIKTARRGDTSGRDKRTSDQSFYLRPILAGVPLHARRISRNSRLAGERLLVTGEDRLRRDPVDDHADRYHRDGEGGDVACHLLRDSFA